MLNRLIELAKSPWYWTTLILLGLSMEVMALVYQYAWDFGPCVDCIFVRVWLLGMIVVSGLALWLRRIAVANILLYGANVGLMIGLLQTSQQLLGTERGTLFGSCAMTLGLPSWFALDEWFPAVFGVWEACGDTPVLLFGITMAEALVVFSWVLLLSSAGLMLAQIAGVVKEKAG